MNYRTFVDSRRQRWEVWLVLPTSAERRGVERRVLADRRAEVRVHSPERRVHSRNRRQGAQRPLGVAAIFADGWLCFEAENEKRRLAPVPKGWDEATPEQLQEWCRIAKRVVKCGPER